MADLLKMDPARIERLRDPRRLETLDPEKVWTVVAPVEDGAIVDVGTGVGYLALPFARRFPNTLVYACDVLDGMLALVRKEARSEGLDNVECVHSRATTIPLPDAVADLVVMAQVHHELDEPEGLLLECHRLLRPGGRLAIIDWKAVDGSGRPRAISAGPRRVPETEIRRQMEAAGFEGTTSHDVYREHCFLTAERGGATDAALGS